MEKNKNELYEFAFSDIVESIDELRKQVEDLKSKVIPAVYKKGEDLYLNNLYRTVDRMDTLSYDVSRCSEMIFEVFKMLKENKRERD